MFPHIFPAPMDPISVDTNVYPTDIFLPSNIPSNPADTFPHIYPTLTNPRGGWRRREHSLDTPEGRIQEQQEDQARLCEDRLAQVRFQPPVQHPAEALPYDPVQGQAEYRVRLTERLLGGENDEGDVPIQERGGQDPAAVRGPEENQRNGNGLPRPPTDRRHRCRKVDHGLDQADQP